MATSGPRTDESPLGAAAEDDERGSNAEPGLRPLRGDLAAAEEPPTLPLLLRVRKEDRGIQRINARQRDGGTGAASGSSTWWSPVPAHICEVALSKCVRHRSERSSIRLLTSPATTSPIDSDVT
eukprot:GHVU01123946.1.p2 GENE.GHVU01123946.1~~GHVU01123946.1.p2  ORF type:complete len:124 (-),score=22.30 GHVU01123946.1:520-891(-)